MPSGITGGSPEPASFDASLALRIGSFLTIGTITPRPTTSSALGERALGRLPGRELDDRAGPPSSARPRAADRRRPRRPAGSASFTGLDRLVLHEVVCAVREPASGENGDGEDGKDSATHEFTCYSFRISADDCIVSGVPTVESASNEPRDRIEHHEIERIVHRDARRGGRPERYVAARR